MLEDNCSDPTKTRGVPDLMPLKHSQDLLTQHHLKGRTENRTGMDTRAEIMQTRWWQRLQHDCRMTSITRTVLKWTPRGKRKTGRPSETKWLKVEKDLNIRGLSVGMDLRASADQARWSTIAVASRARRRRKDECVCRLLQWYNFNRQNNDH